jgi:hypothetical protein
MKLSHIQDKGDACRDNAYPEAAIAFRDFFATRNLHSLSTRHCRYVTRKAFSTLICWGPYNSMISGDSSSLRDHTIRYMLVWSWVNYIAFDDAHLAHESSFLPSDTFAMYLLFKVFSILTPRLSCELSRQKYIPFCLAIIERSNGRPLPNRLNFDGRNDGSES